MIRKEVALLIYNFLETYGKAPTAGHPQMLLMVGRLENLLQDVQHDLEYGVVPQLLPLLLDHMSLSLEPLIKISAK